MEFRVFISDEAKLSISAIKARLSQIASIEIAKKVAKELVSAAKSLRTNPRRCPRLQTSERLAVELRCMVKNNYKIIDQVEEDYVVILAFLSAKKAYLGSPEV